MHAIQFLAKPEKGKIEIPQEYQKELQDQILVIIVKSTPSSALKNRSLSEPSIKTKGFKFNRDEANER
ncbi:MAG TPA: hypothetical protein VHA52_00110 [Candidatus Babeliaceae bacterium]|nr:hypothetical protein [Candidatus Babeliaceae bacterium]